MPTYRTIQSAEDKIRARIAEESTIQSLRLYTALKEGFVAFSMTDVFGNRDVNLVAFYAGGSLNVVAVPYTPATSKIDFAWQYNDSLDDDYTILDDEAIVTMRHELSDGEMRRLYVTVGGEKAVGVLSVRLEKAEGMKIAEVVTDLAERAARAEAKVAMTELLMQMLGGRGRGGFGGGMGGLDLDDLFGN